jgi:hypothetical protein
MRSRNATNNGTTAGKVVQAQGMYFEGDHIVVDE